MTNQRWTYLDLGEVVDADNVEILICTLPVENDEIGELIAASPALLAACQAVMPIGIDTENPNIPDDQVIPLDVTMGELRQLRAAITQATQDHGGDRG